jgi:hypothetical protein
MKVTVKPEGGAMRVEVDASERCDDDIKGDVGRCRLHIGHMGAHEAETPHGVACWSRTIYSIQIWEK